MGRPRPQADKQPMARAVRRGKTAPDGAEEIQPHSRAPGKIWWEIGDKAVGVDPGGKEGLAERQSRSRHGGEGGLAWGRAGGGMANDPDRRLTGGLKSQLLDPGHSAAHARMVARAAGQGKVSLPSASATTRML